MFSYQSPENSFGSCHYCCRSAKRKWFNGYPCCHSSTKITFLGSLQGFIFSDNPFWDFLLPHPPPPLSFLSTIAHPLSTNFSLPNEPSTAVKIKDGSHNFHLQNIEHSHSQMPRVKPHNQKSSTGIA